MKRSSSLSQRVSTLLPIYYDCLDHEAAAASSHQNVLLSLQVGLVGIQYFSSNDMSNFWIIAGMGILLCFFLGPLYEYRVNNVDYWGSEILLLTKGTPLEKTFHKGGYGGGLFGDLWKVIRPFSHWFTFFLIPAIILGWFTALAFFQPELFKTQQSPNPVWIILGIVFAIIWWIMMSLLQKKQRHLSEK
jgi:hypothetical protein